ncbi:MAG: S8 family serine peptidase, partial [Candidatus Sericytochromatia bacterium]|nr:S8 family serine peptidase [Candidatus Sericytochromatia bacterium]
MRHRSDARIRGGLTALALALSLTACEPLGPRPFVATMALDEPPDFSPDAPGADTLGGKLHYNLASVPRAGKIFVLRRAAEAPDGALVVEAIDSDDRQADIRRLVGDDAGAVVEPDIPLESSYTPNDPNLARQWGLARIQAPLAWDRARGGPLVAVIDTGVAAGHPDLAGQVLQGRDFVNQDQDASDDQGHGTHVAGTIAALADNQLGAAGVAPASKVLPIKVLDAQGRGSSVGVAEGIRFATRAGAKVINLSLGSPFPSFFVRAAVAEAVAAGVVVVAAAGNNGSTRRFYPAAFPGVVAVGASTYQDTRAAFSNHGPWVAVAAPGQAIYQTALRNGYASLNGTSMAAPHVAGAAALVLGAHPDWGADRVRDALIRTGDPVRGFDLNPALRRLNVAQALAYVPAPSPVAGGGSPGPAPTPQAPLTPAPQLTLTPPVPPAPSASTFTPPASPAPQASSSAPPASLRPVGPSALPATPTPAASGGTPPVSPSPLASTVTPRPSQPPS